jgi:anti-anti-sigma factor
VRIICNEEGQTCLMKLSGEFCAEDAEPFRLAANDRLGRDVRDFVLEMSEVDFLDSKALETLLWLLDACEERLGQVRLAALQEGPQTILAMTRLAARFSCHEDVATAQRSLR